MKRMFLAGAAFAALGTTAAFAVTGTGSVTHNFVTNSTFNYQISASANVPAFCQLSLSDSAIFSAGAPTSNLGATTWSLNFGDVTDANFNLVANQYAYVKLSAKCNLNRTVNYTAAAGNGRLITGAGTDINGFKQAIPYLLTVRDATYTNVLASGTGTDIDGGGISGNFGPGSSLTTGAVGWAQIDLTNPGGPLVSGTYTETINFSVYLTT